MPPGHWLWGHLPERASDPLGLYLKSQQRLGDVVRYRIGYVFVEQLTHPDHVKHVLVDACARYTKGTVFDKTRPLVGNGLLTAEGDFWKRQRRLAQPAFHRERLAALGARMTDTLSETLQDWERAVDGGTPLPVFQEMMRLTLTVVVRALFRRGRGPGRPHRGRGLHHLARGHQREPAAHAPQPRLPPGGGHPGRHRARHHLPAPRGRGAIG